MDLSKLSGYSLQRAEARTSKVLASARREKNTALIKRARILVRNLREEMYNRKK